MSDKPDTQPALEKIAEALLEIGETLETLLSLMQEREAGFKARAGRPSFGDRKPYERKSYSRDDAGRAMKTVVNASPIANLMGINPPMRRNGLMGINRPMVKRNHLAVASAVSRMRKNRTSRVAHHRALGIKNRPLVKHTRADTKFIK
jgi:hypothetical protein